MEVSVVKPVIDESKNFFLEQLEIQGQNKKKLEGLKASFSDLKFVETSQKHQVNLFAFTFLFNSFCVLTRSKSSKPL